MLESYFYRVRVATQNLPHIAKQLRRFWRGACEERLIFCMRQPQEKKRERADWRGMRFAAGKMAHAGQVFADGIGADLNGMSLRLLKLSSVGGPIKCDVDLRAEGYYTPSGAFAASLSTWNILMSNSGADAMTKSKVSDCIFS